MNIALVVAAAENGVIGRSGTLLPWRLPADLAHFKQLTLGRPIIMGRKTYDTIGRPLPGRRNIIITRNADFHAPGCEVVNSLEAALKAAQADDPGTIFVIGGGQIFEAALPIAERIYLTHVHAKPKGDAYFHYDKSIWHEINRESHHADDKNEYPYTFMTLSRDLVH